MLGSDILLKAYQLTNTNSTTFLGGSSVEIYKRLNEAYGHRIMDILRVRVDRNATIQNATATLKSTVGLVEGNNGFNGEYSFPTDLLRPTRFEISYDGITWTKCQIYDNALNLGSEYNKTQLESQFSTSAPCVDFFRDSYKIRPPKNTAGDIALGIYIEYEKRQSDFTSSTSPVQIEQNLQDLLAYDLAEGEFIMNASIHDQKQMDRFDKEKKELENKFLEHYKDNLSSRKVMSFNLRQAN